MKKFWKVYSWNELKLLEDHQNFSPLESLSFLINLDSEWKVGEYLVFGGGFLLYCLRNIPIEYWEKHPCPYKEPKNSSKRMERETYAHAPPPPHAHAHEKYSMNCTMLWTRIAGADGVEIIMCCRSLYSGFISSLNGSGAKIAFFVKPIWWNFQQLGEWIIITMLLLPILLYQKRYILISIL